MSTHYIPIKWTTVSSLESIVYTRWSSSQNSYVLGLSNKDTVVTLNGSTIKPPSVYLEPPVEYPMLAECFNTFFKKGLKPLKGHQFFVTFTKSWNSVHILLTWGVLLSNQFNTLTTSQPAFKLPKVHGVRNPGEILSRYERKWVI